MDIQTKTRGIVHIEENQKFTFPGGVFGFEGFTEYALFEAEYEPFLWLQSLKKPELAFLVVDPFLICSDYEVDIDDKNLAAIGVASPSDVQIFAIVTVPSDSGEVTVNLQGPLVFNKKNNSCIQTILHDTRWTTKHNVVEEVKRKGAVC